MINLIVLTDGDPKDIGDDEMQAVEDALYDLNLDVWSISVYKADVAPPPDAVFSNFNSVLREVSRELNRTYEQLGSDATEADYAADVIRRLSHLYETGETK